MIDLHAHILPGLDDGPDGTDEAAAMCRLAAEDGTTCIVATPHMLNGVHQVDSPSIRDGVGSLQAVLDAEGVALRLLPGADVHAHGDLVDLLARDEVMTVADRRKYLMVELSHDSIPPYVGELLFSLQIHGVTPLLTNPERNAEVQRDVGVLLPLVRAGNLVQITAASLTGDFGTAPERCARDLLLRDMAHVVASDAHSISGRPPGLSRARAAVESLLGAADAERMFEEYPEAIVRGDPVDTPDPRDTPRKRWRGTWGWLRR